MANDPFFDVSAALTIWDDTPALTYFDGKWSDKHWMNTPGPIYCGDTDNCGTGPIEAPNNVQLDSRGYQVVFRQPVNRYELRQVLQAVEHDPFHGYGRDGDAHWSYPTIQTWWSDVRPEIEQEVARERKSRLYRGATEDGLTRWLDYIRHSLHEYLRAYAFYLEEGRVPVEDDELPTL